MRCFVAAGEFEKIFAQAKWKEVLVDEDLPNTVLVCSHNNFIDALHEAYNADMSALKQKFMNSTHREAMLQDELREKIDP